MRITHGQSFKGRQTKAYMLWANIHQRCSNPNHHAYAEYGGRGIRVCARWSSFENFFADMGAPPKGLTLDRRNNNKGYSKANCRWATRREQSLNRRNARYITFAGTTLRLEEWAGQCGLKMITLWQRIDRGWSAERALTTPPQAPRKYFLRRTELS